MTAGRSCRRLEPRHYGTTIAAAEEAVVGLYGERVLPRIINVACGMKTAEPLRRRVCEGLAGDVVEIGFGSGLNIPFYPAAVTQVAAVDPAEVGWKLADKRLRATTPSASPCLRSRAGQARVSDSASLSKELDQPATAWSPPVSPTTWQVISVRSPRSPSVTVTNRSTSRSRHTRRSGSTTSRYVPPLEYSVPSSETITNSQVPPGRTSMLILDNGVV